MDKEKIMIMAVVTAAVVVCLSATYILYSDNGGNETHLVRDGVCYELFDDGTATVCNCVSSESGTLTIPSAVTAGNTDYVVTIIDEYAFDSALFTEVVIPDTVSVIAPMAFVNSELKTMVLPDSVVAIGYGAFEDCGSLESVFISRNVSTIGNDVFAYCYSLIDIRVDERNTTYSVAGGLLIDNRESILLFVSPSVGGHLDIPEVSVIGSRAFTASNVSSISIPSTVVRMSDECLDGRSITDIDVDAANLYYSSQDGVMMNKDGSELLKFPMAKSGSYTVPDSVRKLVTDSFYKCSELQSITIPGSVEAIGHYVFKDCDSLTEISFGEGDTEIHGTSFDGFVFYASPDSETPLPMDELSGYTYRGDDGRMVRVI